jgi:C1A family cysteine protease
MSINLVFIIVLIILILVLILILKRQHDREAVNLKRRRHRYYEARKAERDRREHHFSVSQPRPQLFSENVEVPLQHKTKVKSSNRATAKPTFERHPELGLCQVDSTYRFEVTATNKKALVDLPPNFSAIKQWSGMIGGIFDQERCGSCWSFCATSCLTDRIRIKSGGSKLQNGDFISPSQLAACMKCGTDNVCPKVCEGNYLDDVFQYLVDNGAVAQSSVDKYTKHGTEYMCMDYKAFGVTPYKAKSKYRVNILPPGQLNTPENLALNENAIMQEIFEHGTIGGILQIFVPPDKRNFYLHQKGVYGYGWKEMPKETDGYHAINIIGWGEDVIDDKVVKFWIIRNSWSEKWGSSGFAKILRGVNFGMIEADCWALSV